MYKFYIDGALLPIAPSKLEMKIKNQNKTISLINEGEVNILKVPGLTEIKFEALLPNQEYAFAEFEGGFQPPSFFLGKLEKLKIDLKPFEFMVVREAGGEILFDTVMKVSLEDYTVKEDAKENNDVIVVINLLQYRDYGIKTLKITSSSKGNTKKKATVTKTRPSSKATPKSYTVKKGDNLWNICKSKLNDSTKCWEIAKKNNIKNPHLIYPGQLIKLD